MDRSQCRRVSPAVAGTGGVQGRVRAIREWPLTLPATGVCSSPIRSIWRHECEWLGFPDVCALVAAGLLWVHNTMPMPTSRRNDSSACRRRHSAGSSRSWLGICVRCTVACQGQPVTGDAPGALRSRGGGESVSGVGRSLVGLPMACCGMVAPSSGRYREGASNLCRLSAGNRCHSPCERPRNCDRGDKILLRIQEKTGYCERGASPEKRCLRCGG